MVNVSEEFDLGGAEKRGFNQLVNYACADLPDGWEIRLVCELGSGIVTLEDPEGNEVDFCRDDMRIEDQWLAAIALAKEKSAGDGGNGDADSAVVTG